MSDCEIVSCSRKQRYASCAQCQKNQSCDKLQSKDSFLKVRLYKQNMAKGKQRLEEQRVSFLAEWYGVLFGLSLCSAFFKIIISPSMLYAIPYGELLNVFFGLASGGVLIKMSGENIRYRTAGICCIVSEFAILSHSFIQSSATQNILTLLISIVSFIGAYYQFEGHREVLSSYNQELSLKWHTLWKWVLGISASIFISSIFQMISPPLGALILGVSLFANFVVSICQYVCLYQTVQVFRNYRK